MKHYLTKILVVGIFSFFLGCRQSTIKKETLYGNWEAVKFDNVPIGEHEFISVKMTITADSIRVITQMKSFADLTTRSESEWSYQNGVIKSKFGDKYKTSHLELIGDNIIFTPDLLFNSEIVHKSEYQRVP